MRFRCFTLFFVNAKRTRQKDPRPYSVYASSYWSAFVCTRSHRVAPPKMRGSAPKHHRLHPTGVRSSRRRLVTFTSTSRFSPRSAVNDERNTFFPRILRWYGVRFSIAETRNVRRLQRAVQTACTYLTIAPPAPLFSHVVCRSLRIHVVPSPHRQFRDHRVFFKFEAKVTTHLWINKWCWR